jgi:hypothetical protein
MAASYSTGSATDPNDLLSKLTDWLVNQGWAWAYVAADGPGVRAHLSKAGQYVHLRSLMNEHPPWYYNDSVHGNGISLYLGTGIDSGLAWNNQPGAPLQSGTSYVIGAGMMLPAGGIAAYHFFDDGADHITVVVERAVANFAHIGWGPSLAKLGYASDHWYFYGSSPGYHNVNSLYSSVPGGDLTAAAPMAHAFTGSWGLCTIAFVRTDAAVFAARWVGLSNSTSIYVGYTGRYGRCALDVTDSVTYRTEIPVIGSMAHRAWQTAFAGALLLPLHCFVQAVSARWIPVGYPPTVFFCAAVGHGFVSGDVYSVGGVDYMVFPGFAVLKAA